MKKFIVGLVILGLVFSMLISFGSIAFSQKKYNEAPM